MSQNDVIKKTLPFIGFKGFLCLKKLIITIFLFFLIFVESLLR